MRRFNRNSEITSKIGSHHWNKKSQNEKKEEEEKKVQFFKSDSEKKEEMKKKMNETNKSTQKEKIVIKSKVLEAIETGDTDKFKKELKELISISDSNINIFFSEKEKCIAYVQENNTPMRMALDNITLLGFACLKKRVDIVKILLSYPNINPNKGSFRECAYDTTTVSPLFFAVEEGNIPIIKLLLSTPGIDIYKGYWRETYMEQSHIESPLLKITSLNDQQKSIDILKLFEKHNDFNINRQDKILTSHLYEVSLVHKCILEENVPLLKYLLKRTDLELKLGNDSKEKEEYSVSNLRLAVEKKNVEIAKILIDEMNKRKITFDIFSKKGNKKSIYEIASESEQMLSAISRLGKKF